MKVLLDTHIWLWYVLGDKKLGKAHREIVSDEHTVLLLSPISIWKAHLLIEHGRIKADRGASIWLADALAKLPVVEARLTFAVAARSRTLQIPHADPADLFIAATAAEMKIPLLTADRHLLACPDIQCIK